MPPWGPDLENKIILFYCILYKKFMNIVKSSCGRDRMVFGFTTSYCICNQCLSPLKLWVRNPFIARRTRYNAMWSSLPVTYGRSVVFSGYTGFLHQLIRPPRYSWNIVESGVKHHKPKPVQYSNLCYHLILNLNFFETINLPFF